MTDKIMAFLALATFIAFLGLVAVYVPDIDLVVIIALISCMVIYDFWTTFRDKKDDS
jgi:hypothetical protein